MAKVNRKELLRKQDEFLTFTEKAVKWAKRNRRGLFIGLGATLTVLVLALSVFSYNRYQHKQAAMAYGQVFYMQQLAQAQDAPGGMEMLIQNYRSFCEDYGSSQAGLQARQCLGSLYMQNGDLIKAEEILREVTQAPGAGKDLLAVTWATLAQGLEMAAKNDAAIEAYGKAVSFSGNNTANIWRSAQARLLMDKDKPAAQALYEQVRHTSAHNYLRFMADRILLNMGVKPIPYPSS